MSLLLASAPGCFIPPDIGVTDKCAACETGVPDTETDTDTDADADTDTDTDTDADLETGLAQFYFIGDFATSVGEFSAAHMGYGLYGLNIDDWACRATGGLLYEGAAPDGCPDCDWAFDLSGATDSRAEGDFCEQFGYADGGLDGYIDYSWGFASTYYYDYNGTPLPLENSLMLYYEGVWFAFAFNYAGRDWVFGDAEYFVLERPAFASGGGYAYYYYYP